MKTLDKISLLENDVDNVHEFEWGYLDKSTGIQHTEYEITEMTGRVEELLARPQIRNNPGKYLNTLLEECIIRIGSLEKASMKKKDWTNVIQSLYIGDQDTAIVNIQRYSMGDEVSFSHECPDCRTKLNSTINISDLEYHELVGEPEFSFELPRGYVDENGEKHTHVEMRLSTGLDREIMGRIQRKDLHIVPRLLLERVVTKVGTAPISSKLFRDMGVKDLNCLFTELKERRFGYDLNVELECSSCGYIFDTDIAISNFM